VDPTGLVKGWAVARVGRLLLDAGYQHWCITAAVKGLDRLDQLVPVVEQLGRRHADYGVIDAHYDTVGSALLWTLEMGLGHAFTADVKDAWATVYGLLATTMKEAAREALTAV
jgi:hemoglobin-like flavoprotein